MYIYIYTYIHIDIYILINLSLPCKLNHMCVFKYDILIFWIGYKNCLLKILYFECTTHLSYSYASKNPSSSEPLSMLNHRFFISAYLQS